MVRSSGYAAHTQHGELTPFNFERREPKPHDVTVQIEYCGICHSDLDFVDNRMGISRYPVVPGHEIVGRVTAVGPAVRKFAVGDRAAIGCYTDSCRVCQPCRSDKQHMCVEGLTGTFGGVERDKVQPTWGGFSNNYVADENYVMRLPEFSSPAAAAPLLCAGITTYSPLRKWQVGPGSTVGIVGLGGLGHMAVKLAVAMGAEVTVFTTSAGKAADAKALGAAGTVISTDAKDMARQGGRFDFILDTVSGPHDIQGYVHCLKADSTLCLLGLDPAPLPISSIPLVFGQKQIAGSLIGGLIETQRMIDFCFEHGIGADIEVIPAQKINTALERLRRNDVKYRFVIDLGTL